MAEHEEEPTLPSMRSANDDDQEEPLPSLPYPKRKRSVASHLFSDSSDVPVFSSDDDPAAENYAQGRRTKKRFVGPWFTSSQPNAPIASASASKKRTLQQVDSGVFMGSDASIDDILDHIPPPSKSRLPGLKHKQPAQPPSPEALARSRIKACLDLGQEVIDLS